jgi:hypothetical protein
VLDEVFVKSCVANYHHDESSGKSEILIAIDVKKN